MLELKKSGKCFIVAEVSANHRQDFNRAVRMIRVAKVCGADAVKFQAYEPQTLTIDADNRHFRISHPRWGGQTLYQLYKKAFTPLSWFKDLKKIADSEGILFFATAFDKESVDLLEEIRVPVHKIASFELIDLPLVEYAAKTKKPLILSTGMADLSEIRDAIRTANKAGAKEILLLKCVSSYPAEYADMHLMTIPDMKKRFGCIVGLSDHTLGLGASIAAVVLGAKVIEKHFTLSRSVKTPDSFFSIEPKELQGLVANIRIAEQALGRVNYELMGQEKSNRIFRRSLFVVKDIKKGGLFTQENIRSIRPAGGIAPKYIHKVLGKRARRDIKRGTPLTKNIFK
jgi:pseudaminic acid synthase